jgi:predicted HAD superfamily Cof-like phosphohydrolase
MSKVFTDVSVFLNACGQEYPKTPDPQVSDLAELYKKLIKEEVEEFWEAEAASDDVEQLDACFDMIWVIVGYMYARGWNPHLAWDEGAQSNLAKIDRNTGKVIRREDGKILKPEGWQTPDFSKFVAKREP